jgi:acyl carrier protein
MSTPSCQKHDNSSGNAQQSAPGEKATPDSHTISRTRTMTDTSAISRDVHAYILQEFLPGEDPDNLTESTALMTGGILSSIATLKLVVFLNEKYDIQVEAHEIEDNLNTIADIANYVHSKLPKA